MPNFENPESYIKSDAEQMQQKEAEKEISRLEETTGSIPLNEYLSKPPEEQQKIGESMKPFLALSLEEQNIRVRDLNRLKRQQQEKPKESILEVSDRIRREIKFYEKILLGTDEAMGNIPTRDYLDAGPEEQKRVASKIKDFSKAPEEEKQKVIKLVEDTKEKLRILKLEFLALREAERNPFVRNLLH